jgi:hypothetical protein
MTRSQKKELGLTARAVFKDLRRLGKEGAINRGMSTKEIALTVAMERSEDECCAGTWDRIFEGTYEIDWDEAMRVLEMIIELLIKYLPILIPT